MPRVHFLLFAAISVSGRKRGGPERWRLANRGFTLRGPARWRLANRGFTLRGPERWRQRFALRGTARWRQRFALRGTARWRQRFALRGPERWRLANMGLLWRFGRCRSKKAKVTKIKSRRLWRCEIASSLW